MFAYGLLIAAMEMEVSTGLGEFTADAQSNLDILRHYRVTLGMYGTKVVVLEKTDKVRL